MWELVCLLLPVAFISGWVVGKGKAKAKAQKKAALSSDYYAGLNFLLNDQTDKAVDAFIRMLEVSPDTVETTLALGNFFRRRGEVARAIRIHQNLIAKPDLTAKQRSQVLLELAQDYLRAGVYDRAESLFLEITPGQGEEFEASLRHLIDIYEREKDWGKAIQAAARLETVSAQSMKPVIAQYYCELAEWVWSKGKIRLAFKYLKKGLQKDKNCARASLLQGNFEKKLGRFTQALRAYQNIEYQDPAFLSEALPMIIACYEKLGAIDALTEYLNYLTHHEALVDSALEKKATYRCGQCGFASQLLHWQCPSCRQWKEIKPIQCVTS
ncbi:MAG: lipopolysaccharide assembly protein LapB [Candidatus Berkiellales bacterium]